MRFIQFFAICTKNKAVFGENLAIFHKNLRISKIIRTFARKRKINELMKATTIHDCKLIDLRKISDPRGNLTVIEEKLDIPFEIRRVYYLYDVPSGESRGAHAHKELYQLLIAANGSFTVTLDDGHEKRSYNLKRPYYGLLIVPGIWCDIDDFSSGSVCLCLASEHYDAADYIRDYDEFIAYKQK